jgi:hypothetical protein
MDHSQNAMSHFSRYIDLKKSAEFDETSNDDRDSTHGRNDVRQLISRDKLAEAFINEMKKIELWTYLFRQLTNITNQLYGMCEIERRPEFCKGVLETIRGIQEEFRQLEKLLMIEQEQPNNYKPFAWNLKRSDATPLPCEIFKDNEVAKPKLTGTDSKEKVLSKSKLSPNIEQLKTQKHVISDFGKIESSAEKRDDNNDEKYEEIFDENGMVEFKLLSELVNEGKMSFYDAIVLLIRERAAFMVDVEAKKGPASRKYSLEESEERAGSTPLNMERLVKRVQTKMRLVENDLEKDNPKEIREQKYREKLSLADNRRMMILDKRQEASNKALCKVEQIRNKHELEQQMKQESIEKKDKEYFKRRLLKLDMIRQKAKENKMKASEISFLLLLEKNAKKINLDMKLEETRKRRHKIIDRISERQKQAEEMITIAKNRREFMAAEKLNLMTKKLRKIEEANQRRKQLLEEKGKRHAVKTLDESFNSKASDPQFNLAQNQSFVLVYLLSEKDKLDQIFKKHQIMKGGCLPLNKQALGRSFSTELIHRKGSDFQTITPDSSFDVEKAKKKKNKRKRKNKKKKADAVVDSPDNFHANISDSERTEYNEQPAKITTQPNEIAGMSKKKKQLASYYKFLTMDTELYEKVRKLKAKNLTILQRKSFASINSQIFSDQISEMPEFFCRELAKEEVAGKMLPSQKMFCTLCDAVLRPEENVDQHLTSKLHKKTRIQYGTTFSEEATAVVIINEKELATERLACLKRKCKKIKQQLTLKALKNESSFSSKEIYATANKPRLQKLSLEFEKLLQGPKRDYETIRFILSDLWKILEKNIENDLHVLRQVRFINSYIEFFKTVNVSLKFEMPILIDIFNDHFKIFARLMLLRENRNFLLVTNRALPLVDLLIWSWNQSSKFLQCLDYIPQIMHIITLLLKSKLAEDKDYFKSSLIEYICFSGFLSRIKSKFITFNESMEAVESTHRTSNIIAKTLNFLETLTYCLENQKGFILAENTQVSPSVIFVIREAEVCGCLQLLASLLLSKGQYKKSTQTLPQNLLVQSFMILKILNNFARSSISDFQFILGGISFNSEQFYHILVFLFDYCTLNYSSSGEVFDLLQQLILLTGYFALNNEHNQRLLSRGTETHTIVYKLANLPYQFYFGEFVFKDLLFPTLLSLVYKNTRNLQILLSEVNKNILLEYAKESKELYRNYDTSQNADLIMKYRAKMEKEQCSLSSNSNAVTNIQNCYHILPFRFPVKDLEDVYSFVESFNQETLDADDGLDSGN